MTKTNVTIYAAMLATCVGVWPAHAGGFLADVLIRPISPQAADDADKLNARLGKPVDHLGYAAVGTAVDAAVPGAGTAVTTVLEHQSQ